jgi:hypothetical protein
MNMADVNLTHEEFLELLGAYFYRLEVEDHDLRVAAKFFLTAQIIDAEQFEKAHALLDHLANKVNEDFENEISNN